jgi:hypothetical protein
MAVFIVPYKDINQTMQGIRTQVVDSLQFCADSMPVFSNPDQMWHGLKQMVRYKHDPAGIELLQSVQTLFDNNYWGVSGSGDCDCFSILVLAMCCVHGWTDQRIVLAGRSKEAPVHIWTEIKWNNDWYCMDLTQPFFNLPRKYKYTQYLYV